MPGVFIVVSGLPASGKTTIGRSVARELGFGCIDKDDILESLFDSLGCNSPARCTELSRASDGVKAKLAEEANNVVLVSFWKTPATRQGGTPASWIPGTFERVIELHCCCSPEVAARRFVARKRHPGHFDAERSLTGCIESFIELSRDGALGIGALLSLNTSDEVVLPGAFDGWVGRTD